MRLPVAFKSFVRGLGRSSHSGRYQDSGVIMEKGNTIIPSSEAFSVLQVFSSSLHPHTYNTKIESVRE